MKRKKVLLNYLINHCNQYPHHQWNKWKLEVRDDENDYKEVYRGQDKFREAYWINKEEGRLSRVGAPASLMFDYEENIIYEDWFIGGCRHRLEGPSHKDNDETSWHLLGCELSEQEHKKIISFYQELGDWSLAFSLSSYTVSHYKRWKEALRDVENELSRL